jgi:feruloyl esterase
MAKCYKVDGLADGLIDDPRRCDFDPALDVPVCQAGSDTPQCLTAAQAGTFKKIYGGAMSGGKPYFPGFMYGSEAMGAGPGETSARMAERHHSATGGRQAG